jgi:hypothetical protein
MSRIRLAGAKCRVATDRDERETLISGTASGVKANGTGLEAAVLRKEALYKRFQPMRSSFTFVGLTTVTYERDTS